MIPDSRLCLSRHSKAKALRKSLRFEKPQKLIKTFLKIINEILKLIDKLLLIYFRKINKNRSDFHEGAMGLTVRRRKRLFFILNRQECEKY